MAISREGAVVVNQVFINLPVSDLSRTMDFYSALGFENNPNFTNDDAAAFQINQHIFLMTLTHGHYSTFTSKSIADASTTSAAINSLSVNTTDEVDALAERAVAAGAKENPGQELGFMRSRSFDDPDGHTWEVFWMDPIAAAGDWAAVQEKYPTPSE